MSEHSTEAQPASVRPRADMRRVVTVAAATAVLTALALYAVFGTFWDKKGVFWGGVHSEAEYRQAVADFQAHRMEPVGQVHRVTVTADGRSTLDYEVHYRLLGRGQAVAWNTWSGKRPPASPYYDARGRRLPCSVRRVAPNAEIYRLRLPPEMGKGDLVMTKGTVPPGACVSIKPQGRDRVYNFRHMYGGAVIRYHHELTLPPGAQVTATAPAPRKITAGKSPVLTWERTLGKMEAFTCQVRYRLLAAEPARKG